MKNIISEIGPDYQRFVSHNAAYIEYKVLVKMNGNNNIRQRTSLSKYKRMKKYIKQASPLMRTVLMGSLLLLVLFAQSAFVSIFSVRTSGEPIIPPGRFRTTVAVKMSHEIPYGSYGSYDLYAYFVGNTAHGYHGPNGAYRPKGEKYLLRYDTLNPGGGHGYEHLITEHPVFLPGESTHYTVGKLLRIHKNYYAFDFQYTISEKKYDRVQFLENRAKSYPQLVNGAEFLVEYWVNNPARAILYIDKPKKDGMPFPTSPDIHVLRPVWDSIPVVLSHKL
jgi:hypothetical protein